MTHRASLLGRGNQYAHLDSPRIRFRRALVLCLMTIVAPGSAQVAVGRRWIGYIALSIYVLLLAGAGVAGWQITHDRATVFGWVTDTDVLLAARIGLGLLAVAWLALFVDAWRLARPFGLTFWRGAVVMTINTALVLVGCGSAVFASQLLSVQRDVVDTVFTATKTSAPLHGRYNILLVGSDSGADRIGIRPDSMTVASIDADTGRTVLVSLPRNLQDVPFPQSSPMHDLFPNGYNCGSECLINAVHTEAENREDLYPNSKDPGLAATIDAVEGATNLKVNYFIMINLKGFKSLVNAVGGVQMDVKTRIAEFGHNDSYKQKYIEPGYQRLDGHQALWYARSRVQSDDYTRMGRQKCLMSSMLKQLSPQKVVLNAQSIAESGKELIRTNMPAKELGQFADLALKSRDTPIATVSLVPPVVSTTAPDFDQVHRLIARAIDDSEAGVKPTKPSATPTDSPTGEPTGGAAQQTPSPGESPSTEGLTTVAPNESQTSANTTADLSASC